MNADVFQRILGEQQNGLSELELMMMEDVQFGLNDFIKDIDDLEGLEDDDSHNLQSRDPLFAKVMLKAPDLPTSLDSLLIDIHKIMEGVDEVVAQNADLLLRSDVKHVEESIQDNDDQATEAALREMSTHFVVLADCVRDSPAGTLEVEASLRATGTLLHALASMASVAQQRMRRLLAHVLRRFQNTLREGMEHPGEEYVERTVARLKEEQRLRELARHQQREQEEGELESAVVEKQQVQLQRSEKLEM